jgi:prefoldin subunit 5
MVEPRKKSDKANEVIEGEIVAEFTGDTVMNLPEVEAPDSMPVYDSGRRGFVLRLMVGGAAAMAMGGGAALMYNSQRREQPVQEVILPYGSQAGDPNSPTNVADLQHQLESLNYNLVARTAERDQALSELTAAEAQVASLQQQLTDAQELLELWQSHDNIGLDGLVSAGLALVYAALRSSMSVLNALEAGVAFVGSLFETFIGQLPGPIEAISWLRNRVTALSNEIASLTQTLQQAVGSGQPFDGTVAEFIFWVLDQLPGNVGTQARAGLEGMQDLVNDLPDMVARINTDVLDPLATWFSADESRNIVGTLVSPIETNLVNPSTNVVTEFRDFATYFEDQLLIPVEDALSKRRTIHEQITAAQTRTDEGA